MGAAVEESRCLAARALASRGVSTGALQEALSALLGADAPNLSPGVISHLTAGRQEDYDRWARRDLSTRRYVHIWAGGVHLQARMEPQAECVRRFHNVSKTWAA